MAEKPIHVQPLSMQPPLDENGHPLVMVRASGNDLIGLPKFSNVTFFAEVVRWSKDDPDEIKAKLEETFDLCEGILGERRQAIVELREQMEGNLPAAAE